MREGFSLLTPKCVHGHKWDPARRQLRVYLPTNTVHHRGDTLSNPELTLTLDSPAEGVVGVTVEHFRGQVDEKPSFAISSEDVEPSWDETERTVNFGSGGLEVSFDKPSGTFDVLVNGVKVTGSGNKALGNLRSEDGQTFTYQELDLGIDACVYGLGERFGPLVKNGQVVDMWNDDSGTSSDRSYKNIPFFFSTDGYGVFVDNPGDVSFEVGSEKVGRVQLSVRGERLRYYLIAGPSPKDILRRYTGLTGRPPRVPAWSYGLWLSTSFLTDYDDRTVAEFINGMADRDIPLSTFHYDCFWMKEFQWCDFEWNDEWFSDPVSRIRSHHEDQRVRVCVWINPYIGARSKLFDEGREKGYLIRKTDGSVYQTDFWQSGMGLVDFTNPEATAWYLRYLDRLLDQGVDSFKTDFGESVPVEDVVYFDGSDPVRMHNYYTHLYNQAVFGLLERRKGKGQAVLFARSATAGGQQYPVHWGGDCEATYTAMAETIRGGLSLAASGFGYWAHDIGGFEHTPPDDLYKRWVAFGLLSSHSRLHGSHSPRVPWDFGDDAVDVLREFTTLKLSLLPTIALAAEQTVTEGIPIVRPMILDFPEDPAVAYLDKQYMLGDHLLVAPVFKPDGSVDFYLPPGTWTNLLTGARHQGGRWVRETHGFHSLPLMVKDGTVLPVQASRQDTEGSLLEHVTLRVFPSAESSRTTVTLLSGFEEGSRAIAVDVGWDREELWAISESPVPGMRLQLGDEVVDFEGTEARMTLKEGAPQH